jgi:hypothetical protein
MASMTNVALATPPAGGPYWTLAFTAAAPGTVSLYNRTPDSAVLVRVNGAAGLATDPLDAPAEVLLPGATMQLAVATGDLVFARLANPKPVVPMTGRITVRA